MWGRAKKKKTLFSQKKYRITRPPVKYYKSTKARAGRLKLRPLHLVNILLVLGIGILLYFFIFSNFYNITEIQVSGNQAISTDDVLNITNQYLNQNTLFVFKHRNIFIFSKQGLFKRLNQSIILSDLKVDKILPNTIKLTLKEKNSALEWQSGNDKFLLDENGQIIKKYYAENSPQIFSLSASPTNAALTQVQPSGPEYLLIRNLSNQFANLGDYVLKPEQVAFIQQLQDKIKPYNYLTYSEIQVPNAYPEYFGLIMAGGWQIQFNLQDSVDAQLTRLNLLINQKIKKQNLSKLEYIDLRLGESIYYKFKDQQAVSQPAQASPQNP